jgi:hypothetical protein
VHDQALKVQGPAKLVLGKVAELKLAIIHSGVKGEVWLWDGEGTGKERGGGGYGKIKKLAALL